MSHTLARLLLMCGLAAVAVTGARLASVVKPSLASVEKLAAVQTVASPARVDPIFVDAEPRDFPPIFGVEQSAMTAPQAKASPKPPIFPEVSLTGILILGDMRRAFVSGSKGEVVLREGDRLGPDATLLSIHPDRVELQIAGQQVSVLFETALGQPSGSVTQFALSGFTSNSDQAVPTPTQMVGSQPMTQSDILALLQDPRAHQTGFIFR